MRTTQASVQKYPVCKTMRMPHARPAATAHAPDPIARLNISLGPLESASRAQACGTQNLSAIQHSLERICRTIRPSKAPSVPRTVPQPRVGLTAPCCTRTTTHAQPRKSKHPHGDGQGYGFPVHAQRNKPQGSTQHLPKEAALVPATTTTTATHDAFVHAGRSR